MNEKLKHCPFCGKTEPLRIYKDEQYWQIVCVYAFDGCGSSSAWYTSIEEAISSWNNRATNKQQAIRDTLTGEDVQLKSQELLPLIQAQLRHLIDINNQITGKSQLLYQEIMRCKGFIEQLKIQEA